RHALSSRDVVRAINPEPDSSARARVSVSKRSASGAGCGRAFRSEPVVDRPAQNVDVGVALKVRDRLGYTNKRRPHIGRGETRSIKTEMEIFSPYRPVVGQPVFYPRAGSPTDLDVGSAANVAIVQARHDRAAVSKEGPRLTAGK